MIQAAGAGSSQAVRSTYSSISGRIGENQASLSLNQYQDSVDISGSVGTHMVNVHQHMSGNSSNISGSISGPGGFKNVSLWVNSYGGNKSISGSIGTDPVNISQRETGNQLSMTGFIGSKYVNIYGYTNPGSANLSGSVGSGVSSYVSLSAFGGSAGQPVNYEGIIPALVCTGRDK